MLDCTLDHIRPPRPCDFTICLHCGHLLAFDRVMAVRQLTSEEMLEVAGHPDLLRAQKFRAAYLNFSPKEPINEP